jgi:hypothetical protein
MDDHVPAILSKSFSLMQLFKDPKIDTWLPPGLLLFAAISVGAHAD